jgi:hypothetical protein
VNGRFAFGLLRRGGLWLNVPCENRWHHPRAFCFDMVFGRRNQAIFGGQGVKSPVLGVTFEYLQLRSLSNAVPNHFRFGFKVTDVITIKKFPNLAQFGAKAGQANQNFLNANLFATAFLKPCESIRSKVDVLMFEFSRFV